MDGEWHVTDLIFELRFLADSRQQMGYDRTGAALDCAADRIEALEAALREAVEDIGEGCYFSALRTLQNALDTPR